MVVAELASAARRPKVSGGGAPMPVDRRRRHVQNVVGGARPVQGSTHKHALALYYMTSCAHFTLNLFFSYTVSAVDVSCPYQQR